MVRTLGLDDALADRLVAHFWTSYDEHCSLSDDTKHTLAALRERGMKLGVITNGDGERQHAKLAALGLESAFDAVLISGVEGVRKPDAEIFRRAVSLCGVRADEAMFVGDHPHIDVEGALAAGLAAVWRHVPYWQLTTAQVPVIRSLAELLPLCLAARRPAS